MFKKIIFYELNEISPTILKKYIDKFPNSALSQFCKVGKSYTTINKDYGPLSPWITWPTLHRGVSNELHKITDIGQNLNEVNSKFPNYFDILVSHGITTGIFGSLQTSPLPNNFFKYLFYLPDTFAGESDSFPTKLEVFQDFNLYMTSKNGKNVIRHLPTSKVFKLLIKLPSLGISNKTVFSIVRQLLIECIKPHLIVRRRSIQSSISFDLYIELLKNTKPMLSTFFTNHVASSMHRYWPATFPKDYEHFKMPSVWIDKYKNEIWEAMNLADNQVSRLMNFCNKNQDYCLVIASSMGQAAVQDSEHMKNQLLLVDTKRFLLFIGIPIDKWKQHLAMSPQYVFEFSEEYYLTQFVNSVHQFTIRDQQVKYQLMGNNAIQIEFGHLNFSEIEQIKFNGLTINPYEVGLGIVPIQDEAGSYAYHIPQGIFMVYNGSSNQSKETIIDTTSIAPSILNHFDVEIPKYMKPPLTIF
jgi:hypothetical protein